MSKFIDDIVTYAVGQFDAERRSAIEAKESYIPATASTVAGKVRERLPRRTDLRSKGIASILGRLASDPVSPVVRDGVLWGRGDRRYKLVDGAFTIQMNGCARCHGAGHDLVCIPLNHPVEKFVSDGRMATGTHWAMCPDTHQPIIVGTIVKEDEPQWEVTYPDA